MKRIFITLRAFAMAAVFGLATVRAQQPAEPAASAPPEKQVTVSSAQAVAYTNSMGALDDKRKIAVGDRLSFRIVEDHKDPVPLMVTDSGEVNVPLIGRVNALNKTCKQLAEEIKSPMEKDYFYKATVIVALDFVSGKSPGRVYVTGNVKSPGPLQIPPDEVLTVSRAILRAGGFDQFANHNKVKLIRKNPSNPSETQTTLIDVGDIIDHGRSDKDMTVNPDDMIVVQRKWINM